jgi:two-component system chemotaxis sensor kinase CheA
MFSEEAGELLAALEQGLVRLGQGPIDRAAVDPVYRAAHSLKGAAGMVGLTAISDLAQAMERSLKPLRTDSTAWSQDLGRALAADRDILAAKVAEEERLFRGASS